jgi:hypothetical protein
MALEVVIVKEPLQRCVEVKAALLLLCLHKGAHQEELNRFVKSFHGPLRLRVVGAPVREQDFLLLGELCHRLIDKFSAVIRLQNLWFAVALEELFEKLDNLSRLFGF